MSAPASWRALPLALGLAALCACNSPIEVRQVARTRPISKLAILPLTTSAEFHGGPEVSSELAREIVTARVLGMLIEHTSFEVIPPSDALLALRKAGLEDASPSGPSVARALERSFGVQAVLSGEVRRFQERRGGPRGATRPAAVAFSLVLRDASGVVLWRGDYEEMQKSLSEDPASFSRARARGFEWVTAERLAHEGAELLVRRLPRPAVSGGPRPREAR